MIKPSAKAVLPKSIVIQLLPSTLLLGLLAAVATVSAMIILQLPITWLIKCAAVLLVTATSVYFILRDALLMLPWSWRRLEVDVTGVLKLTNKKQQVIKTQLAASTFTHEYLTILNFERVGLNWLFPPVLLLNDFPEKNALRQLRVWIRVFKHDKNHRDDQPIEAS